MIAATNQAGFVVQRFDGASVGWTAITKPFTTRAWAHAALTQVERTPGAEYRVYPALKGRAVAASLILAAMLSTACGQHVEPAHYECSPEQRERAHVEAMRRIELVNAWDAWARRTVYESVIAQNCVVAP